MPGNTADSPFVCALLRVFAGYLRYGMKEEKMRKVLCATGVFLFMIAASVFAGSFRNEPQDFRGITWSAEIKDVPDMSPLFDPKENYDVFYTKKDDDLKFGDVQMKVVKYGFYDGKFYQALLEYADKANVAKLKEALEAKYGPGRRPNQRFEQYLWIGEKVDIDLYFSSMKDWGKLTFTYKPLYKQKKIDEKMESRQKSRQPHGSMEDFK